MSSDTGPSSNRSTLTQGYLFWAGKRRDIATMEAVVDLSAGDNWVVLHSGPLVLQLGGTFAGVAIPYQTAAAVDGSVLRICLGRLPPRTAQAVGKAWYEAMVMRVRATLTAARAATPRWPGAPFEVI